MERISRAERRRSRREEEKRIEWATLEEFARLKIQGWLQRLLDEEVTELLGREKSERRALVDAAEEYRNGHGKPRRLGMTAGTITVRRPRVRNLEEHFESRILPLFVRRTQEVADVRDGEGLPRFIEKEFRGFLTCGAPGPGVPSISLECVQVRAPGSFLVQRPLRVRQLRCPAHDRAGSAPCR